MSNSTTPVHKNSDNPDSLLRRRVVLGAATLAAMGASGVSLASGDHEHMHQGKNPHQAVIDTALKCLASGQACLDHCMELFKQGDTSVADCADSVNEMLAMCTALSQMASYRSSHLLAMARVCADVCRDCEKACRKHEKKHAQCRACANDCADCIKACEAIGA